MKTLKLFLFVALMASSAFAQQHLQKPANLKALNDTIVFDINQAVYSNTAGINYIEFPIILKSSNTAINSFDFWFQFNVNKLTYVSTAAVISGLDAFSNYNTSNFYLSNTSSGTSISFNIPTNIPVITLKFELATACTEITQADFSNVTTLFNGDVSAYKFIAQTDHPIDITSPDPLCTSNYIEFTYPTTIYGKPISNFQWDFGNGDISTNQTDSTIFTSGTHTVTLTVITIDGCTHTVTRDVTILEGPNAAFNALLDANFFTYNFINQSTILSGSIISYLWDFGDQTATSDLENPNHDYQSHSSFLVSLTVTSDNGCVNVYDSIVSTTDGLAELLYNQFEISPNPTSNSCHIYAKHGFDGELELRNANGQLVFKSAFKGNEEYIDLTHLSPGVYFCNIYNYLGQRSLKVIKL